MRDVLACCPSVLSRLEGPGLPWTPRGPNLGAGQEEDRAALGDGSGRSREGGRAGGQGDGDAAQGLICPWGGETGMLTPKRLRSCLADPQARAAFIEDLALPG